MKKLILAGAALLTGTAIALPANAEVFNGFYIGAEAGVDKDAVHVNGSGVHVGSNSNFGYGMIAGLDFKVLPNIVIGAEGDVSLDHNDFNFNNGVTIFSGKSKRTFGLTGRVGYLLGGRFLVYGRAGYENAAFRFSDSLSTSKHNFDGFKYGAGVELGLLANLAVRLEYDHTNFNSATPLTTSPTATFSPGKSRVMGAAALYF
jgi:opacity protein-like surface antigen